MQKILNEETQDVGNRQVQKWYKNCGVPAVILTVFSMLFCQTMYSENQALQTQIIKERADHTADLRENTAFIQSLLNKK